MDVPARTGSSLAEVYKHSDSAQSSIAISISTDQHGRHHRLTHMNGAQTRAAAVEATTVAAAAAVDGGGADSRATTHAPGHGEREEEQESER